MSVRFWKQLTDTFRRLSPESIQREADRPFTLALVGTRPELSAWVEALVPPESSERKRDQAMKRLFIVEWPFTEGYARMLPQFDLRLATPSVGAGLRELTRDYVLVPPVPAANPEWPACVMDDIFDQKPELRLALARQYSPLRDAVVKRIIAAIARENAAFAVVTALPNIIPSPIELPWAIGEFASDTMLITANQLRMAFLIAAASDSPVGWREQKGQLGSIVGSAFGWRALARELAGKMPSGTGLVAKGLIAYSATHVVGRGLEQFHRIGRHLSRVEKQQAYHEAYASGRKIVEEIARKLARRERATSA